MMMRKSSDTLSPVPLEAGEGGSSGRGGHAVLGFTPAQEGGGSPG